MKKISFGQALKSREKLIGINLTIYSPELCEIVAASQIDWVFIDLEHSSISFSELRCMLQILQPETYAAVRIGDQDESTIKKVLDLGADGIIIPQISSVEEMRKMISYSKYTPLGNRSVGMYRAHAYGNEFKSYLQSANDDVAVIALIESQVGVENIAEIVAVEGLAAVFIGPSDLSASLGVIGEVEHAKVISAITTVREVCVKNELSVGIYLPDLAKKAEFYSLGYNFLSCGSDLNFLTSGINNICKNCK